MENSDDGDGRRSPKSAERLSGRSSNYVYEKIGTRNEKQSNAFILWWPEIASIAMSIVSMVAMVGLLIAIQNTPLESWNAPWHIQPNTLIATLIAVCKLFMVVVLAEGLSQLKWVYFQQQPHALREFDVFDAASRGPLGSVHLLFHVRWKAVVATIGALTTLLALAMEPFAQEVISYHTETYVAGDALASMPRSQAYELEKPLNTHMLSQLTNYGG